MQDIQVGNQALTKIGSFRCNTSDIEKHLPVELYKAIFDEVPDGQDIKNLINVQHDKVHFNNGAFGNSYVDVRKLSVLLRAYSESHSDVFYDQVCLPLIHLTYDIVEEFFGTKNVLLVPNCTFGMKSVADHLIYEKQHSSIACLYPIYGATQKLLEHYKSTNIIKSVSTISPGQNALLEEDHLTIVQSLKSAYNERKFTVLFCDETASQSGRILPLDVISKFCKAKDIVLVVDGTQSCRLFFGERKRVLDSLDYFVMSTHKWIGNVKTCGVIRYLAEAPTPPVISFGWKLESNKHQTVTNARERFIWQGMLDSYVSYICLGKALKIFSKYGEEQIVASSKLLEEGLIEKLHVSPLLPVSVNRVMNIFELENSQLEPLRDINKIQNTLQGYGIYISVKKFGHDCSGISVGDQKLMKKNIKINEAQIHDYHADHEVHTHSEYSNGDEQNINANRNRTNEYDKHIHGNSKRMNGDYQQAIVASSKNVDRDDQHTTSNHKEVNKDDQHSSGISKQLNEREKQVNSDIGKNKSNIEPDHSANVQQKDNGNTDVCLRPSHSYYLRISCWSFNTMDDFESVNLALHNNLKLSTTTNEGLRQQFIWVYELYEKLFSTLKTKAFFIRAERLRHHLIFYYGHTAVFYINKLIVSGHLSHTCRFNPRIESSFAVGVDEMSWDDTLEDNYDWSGMSFAKLEDFLGRVQEYRNWVKDLVLKLIDENPVVNPIALGSFHWIMLMGIEHEKAHLETSAVIISQVSINLIKKKHDFNFPTYWKGKPHMVLQTNTEPVNTVQSNELVVIPSGTVSMGKNYLEKNIYGWDNEFGAETKILESFEASQMLVSNAEYLKFIQAGAYTKDGKKWWSSEGWRFVEDLKVSGPRFWIGQTHYRALLEEIPMPWNFPVEVNNLEAEAFCNWKSEQVGKTLRLISHEESFHMRQIAKEENSNTNLNKYASPTPVDLYGGYIDGKKVYDISGNVWRHSVSVLTVMEGFRTDPYYNDYTLPSIDGHHNHIIGGSWISVGNSANLNARNFFRRHFYQYAGIRYVCSHNDYHERAPTMFDDIAVTRRITEHYSDFTCDTLVEKKPIKNWPRCFGDKGVHFIKQESLDGKRPIKVLVAYGSTGRSTLELLRQCTNLSIDHTDTTTNTLQVLECLLKESKIHWYQQIEGKITHAMQYQLEKFEESNSLLNDKGNSISYWQADYTNLRHQLNDYDVIVTDMRHKDAAYELMNMTSRLKVGGVLVLGSIDDVRAKDHYGKKHSLTVLQKYYVQIGGENDLEYPHIYRETSNKHQYAISHFSAWRKKTEKFQTENDEQQANKVATSALTTDEYYENKNILTSYDQFHFGDGLLGVKNFPLRMAEICVQVCKKFNVKLEAALDAGCGPGRTAIELCAKFRKVEAYDFSQSFVDMLMEQKKIRNLVNLTPYQGDSHKQKDVCQNKEFDLILGCNLIDRLHSPEQWILQSKEMLATNGLLIIASPYTWKPEHTHPEKWIGGFKKNSEDHYTVNGLSELLSPDLVLLQEMKVPFVILDADGTYQYTYSNCTVFGTTR